MSLGFDIVKKEREDLKTKRKLALEMWSGKGSQLQGKALGYRGESPRPEADSNREKGAESKGQSFPKHATGTNSSFERFKTKNTNSFFEQRAVSFGCPAPI